MTAKQKDNRINFKDLPKAEREVSPKEAKEVGGGISLPDLMVTGYQSGDAPGGDVANRPGRGGDDVLVGGTTSYGK